MPYFAYQRRAEFPLPCRGPVFPHHIVPDATQKNDVLDFFAFISQLFNKHIAFIENM